MKAFITTFQRHLVGRAAYHKASLTAWAVAALQDESLCPASEINWTRYAMALAELKNREYESKY